MKTKYIDLPDPEDTSTEKEKFIDTWNYLKHNIEFLTRKTYGSLIDQKEEIYDVDNIGQSSLFMPFGQNIRDSIENYTLLLINLLRVVVQERIKMQNFILGLMAYEKTINPEITEDELITKYQKRLYKSCQKVAFKKKIHNDNIFNHVDDLSDEFKKYILDCINLSSYYLYDKTNRLRTTYKKTQYNFNLLLSFLAVIHKTYAAIKLRPLRDIRDIINEASSDLDSLQKLENIYTNEKREKLCLSVYQNLEAKAKNLGIQDTLPTGLSIDELTDGVRNGEMIIIGARPSMGKTSLAINIALNMVQSIPAHNANKSILFISIETSEEQIIQKMLGIIGDVDFYRIRTGRMSEFDLRQIEDAARTLSKLPIIIDSSSRATIRSIKSTFRKNVKSNIGCIIIDYLQIMHTDEAQDTQYKVVSEISSELKKLARALNIPIISLCQLSRAVEYRTDNVPTLSDLRGSGSIEQDADIVMFLYREAYYLERKKPQDQKSHAYLEWEEQMMAKHNQAEIIVAKNRNGPVGKKMLWFDPKKGLFKNWDNACVTNYKPLSLN